MNNLDILHNIAVQLRFLKQPDPETLDQTEIIVRRAIAIVDFLPEFEQKQFVLGQLQEAMSSRLGSIRDMCAEDGEANCTNDLQELLRLVKAAIAHVLDTHKYVPEPEPEIA